MKEEAARRLFEYLYVKDAPSRAEAIIGFGHFDVKIAHRCAQLYLNGLAPRLIFTGGIGAGTADLGEAEALAFERVLHRAYPTIPPQALLIETASTNTGENMRFTAQLLQQHYPDLAFGRGIQRTLIVANAYRQRRVYLTCQLYFPHLSWINCPPQTSYEQESALFASKGEELHQHLVGEIDRLRSYPAQGFMASTSIPHSILEAYQVLKG